MMRRGVVMPRVLANVTKKSPSLNVRSKSAAAMELEAQSVSTTAPSTTSSNVPILQSLLAALAGVVTVSTAAAVVESATASSCPKYTSATTERFDQSKYSGRFSKMLLACDPRLLLYSDAQVRQYQQLLNKHHARLQASNKSLAKENSDNESLVDDRLLFEARRIVQAAVHPDTGDIVPRPFRMSGYVPYNGPICVAMVASASTSSLLFWSWMNQSQNAAVNYYNRNAAAPLSNQTLATSYGVAVTSSLAVAFGLATLIQKRYSPTVAQRLLKWVAFPSAIVASSLNCYVVRSGVSEKQAVVGS
jgi:hypothetical protein